MSNGKIQAILFYPKVGDEDYAQPLMPLSVLAPASAAQKAGFDVEIIDQRLDRNWQKTVKEYTSDAMLAFGISSMTGPQLKYAAEIAEFLKLNYPQIPVVWGGVHASLLPVQTLDSGYADIIVQKEGEVTFVDLLRALNDKTELSKVDGIAFKDSSGNAVITEERVFCDLDNFADLDFELLELPKYQIQGTDRAIRENSVSLYTSRGCPAGCTYCYNCSYHNRKWRGQSAEVVFGNLMKLYSSGIRNIILCDEYFFHDIQRARTICQKLVDASIKVRFFYANCKISQILIMTDDDLKLFSQVGFKDLFVGIETGSNRMQKVIKKYINIEDVLPAALRLRKFGITAQFSFLLGLPKEEILDMKNTINLMVKVLTKIPETVMCGAGKFIPFPGTEAYEQVCQCGWNPPTNLLEWSNITFTNEATWLSPKLRKVLEQTLFLTYVLDTKINPRASMPLEFLRKIYSKYSRLRCALGLISFVPEFNIMKSPIRKLLQKKLK